MEPQLGALIDDRYVIEVVIGRGGMGTVFRARHRYTGVQVALKIMRAELALDDDIIQRFLAEARAPSVIGHPAIVAITDANRTSDGLLYMAMELLHGRSLRSAMEQGSTGDDVRRIGLELLDALASAHARGMVHRDLKPENIFLAAPGGAVRLLDFGIAKVLGADTRTQQGRILGTIEYMAPEQLLDARSVDPRADLWSVGMILYEMIAGLRPFSGATREEKFVSLINDEPMPIEDVASVSPSVAQFFARALSRDPARRFASAAEMAAALRTLELGGKASSATSSPTLGSGPQWQQPQHGAAQLSQHGAGSQHGGASSQVSQHGGSHVSQHGGASQVSQHGVSQHGGASQVSQHGVSQHGGASQVSQHGVSQHGGASQVSQHGVSQHGGASQISQPGAARRRWPLVVALVAVALVGGGIVLGLATRGGAAASGSDAGGARVDPAGSARIEPGSAVVATAPDARCDALCKKLDGCGLAQRSCPADCRTKQILVDCIDAATGCDALAGCAWKWLSNAQAAGTGLCWSGVKCFESCGGDAACRGACVAKLTPASATKLARVYLCRTDCGEDLTCFGERCQPHVPACFEEK